MFSSEEEVLRAAWQDRDNLLAQGQEANNSSNQSDSNSEDRLINADGVDLIDMLEAVVGNGEQPDRAGRPRKETPRAQTPAPSG